MEEWPINEVDKSTELGKQLILESEELEVESKDFETEQLELEELLEDLKRVKAK